MSQLLIETKKKIVKKGINLWFKKNKKIVQHTIFNFIIIYYDQFFVIKSMSMHLQYVCIIIQLKFTKNMNKTSAIFYIFSIKMRMIFKLKYSKCVCEWDLTPTQVRNCTYTLHKPNSKAAGHANRVTTCFCYHAGSQVPSLVNSHHTLTVRFIICVPYFITLVLVWQMIYTQSRSLLVLLRGVITVKPKDKSGHMIDFLLTRSIRWSSGLQTWRLTHSGRSECSDPFITVSFATLQLLSLLV